MSMLRNLPFSGDFPVSLRFGESHDLFKRLSFKGVPLLGHPGLDFDLPLRTPVLAVQHGVVLDVRSDPDGYGDSVLLSHRWGQTFYAHLSEVRVEKGQQAAAGQTIGLSGDSGVIEQPTMHFGMRLIPYSIDDGWCGFTDPTPYLARLTQPRGAIIGPHIIGSIRPHLEVLSRWRPRMITLLDPSPDDLLALRDVCPDSTIVARIFVPDHEMSERINKDPVEAAHWAHEITETRMAYGVDYWQVANEVHQDHDGLRKLNQFELTRMALADEAGYRCAILAFSVGNPDLPENDRMAVWKHVYPALAHAEEKGHVVALHQYGMPDLWGPNNAYDWYIYRLEHQVLRRLPFRQLKFAVTEYGIDGLIRGNEASGWQNFTTPEGYVEQLLKCGRYLERFSGQVLGYTIFTLGHYNPWQSYDIIGKAAAYLADLSEKGTWREIDAQVYDIVPRDTDNTTDVGPTIIASMIPPEEPTDESEGNPPPAPDASSEEVEQESTSGIPDGTAPGGGEVDGFDGGFDTDAFDAEAELEPETAEPDDAGPQGTAADTDADTTTEADSGSEAKRKSRRRRRASSAASDNLAASDEPPLDAEAPDQPESLDTISVPDSENEFVIPSAVDAFEADRESTSAPTSDDHAEPLTGSTQEADEDAAMADDEQETLEDVMPSDANAVESQQPTALLDLPEAEETDESTAHLGSVPGESEPVESSTQAAESTQDESAAQGDTLASIIAAMSGDNAADAENSDSDTSDEGQAEPEMPDEPPARTAPLFEQRIALPFAAYNMRIEGIKTRPDQPLTGQGPLVNDPADVEEVVYLVKDLFMTYYGSWEPSGEYESVPDWARDDYLRPSFLEAGADHHLFAAVIGLNGEMTKGHEIVFWSDGFERLGDSSYADYTRESTKESSGWANLFMAGGSSYVPQRGDTGPWCWAPAGAAEVVVGGGLPVGHPVSTFVVWQAVLRSEWEATLKPDTETPVEPPPPIEPEEPSEPTPPDGGTTPTPKIEVERRISEWIPHYNVSVQPLMARPDQPTGDVVYILKDLFTTASGSWEHSDLPGSVPEWARDEYLKPAGASDYFDDAGGDHHLFAAVIGLDGKLVRNHEIVYWSDGFEMLGDPDYEGYVRRMTKERSGWANVITGPGSSFVPERNESGPWCWAPAGASEVVCGGGLPLNHHISFFAVWQAVSTTEGSTPDDGKDDWNNDTYIPTVPKDIKPSASEQFPPVDANAMVLHMYRQAAWNRLGLELPVDTHISAYARRNRLGRPVTQEFELNGQRIQGYNEAIVCMPVGQPQSITHIPW